MVESLSINKDSPCSTFLGSNPGRTTINPTSCVSRCQTMDGARGLEEELLLLNWTSAPCRRHSKTAPPLSRQPAQERITVDISIS
ncbi:hypothetical protein J6590_101320 [Homalodisca vitripennis]|nr:hypothetical protein J6590_101320 [Homalodisca vitripennis]